MITLLSGIVFVLHGIGIYGFNVDIGSAVVYNGPAKSEYFGYSVALHSYQNKYWVIVGAPLSNVTDRYDPAETLPRFGAVYKCEYTGSQTCSFIEIDNTPDRTEYSKLNDVPMTLKLEEKSGQWLGGTVYSTGTNGRALACASRYIYRGLPPDPSGDMHYRWVFGRCFLLRNDLSSPQYTREPCFDEITGNNEYGYCQAGFSAEFTPDGSDVVMGMVGANRWKGGFVMTSAGNTLYKALSPRDQIDYGNYMGYSVTSGFFSSKSVAEAVAGAPRGSDLKGKVLIYDIASNYPQISVSSQLPPPKDIPIGTYFGSVLCAVDLDNDQFTDILVGAPYYTHVIDEGRVYIYLNNKQGALNLQDKVLEGDKKPNGRFGSAIAAVGDLNQDGFEDVAIGAPMEGDDGSGAVYIYHGSSKGIETSYRQKILGSKVQAGLKMFGLSISGGVDVDKNKYPDIAVGAYGSENAVILRTNKIVNVDGVITLSKTQISLESNDSLCDLDGAKHICLNMTIMLVYSDQVENGNGALGIKYKVELDKGKESDALRRMFFWDAANSKKNFILEKDYTLQNKRTQYEMAPVTVYLLDRAEVADVGSLLTFDLTVTLPTTGCVGLCPVLNDYRPNTFRETVAFLKKCKNKLACVPDLAVDGKIIYSPGDLDEVRIGVVKDFTVELDITNKVEDSAYYSQIFLKHPADLDYIGTDKPAIECERGESDNGTSTVTCNVGNPLQGKSTVKFGIKFAPGSIKESFTMEVLAKSQDKDANDKDNKKVFSVPVKFEADVEIKGIAKHRQVVYKGPVRVEDDVKKSLDSIGPEVIQTLTIRNRGPSAVDGSVVTINYPALYQSSKPDSYLLYLLLVELEGASGSCDAKVNPLDIKASNDTSEENTQQQSQSQSRKRRDTENKVLNCRTGSCNTFSCNLGQLKVNDKVDIKLTFRLWDNTLLKELDPPEPVDLVTEAKIKVPSQITQPDEDNDKTTVVTTAKPAQTEAQKKKTPWWVILLSVLGGVLLLGGAAAVLWKLGFFKRKRIKDISGPEVNEMTVQ